MSVRRFRSGDLGAGCLGAGVERVGVVAGRVYPALADAVLQIIVVEAGQRALNGESQEVIADAMRPAIEALLDDLDSWMA